MTSLLGVTESRLYGRRKTESCTAQSVHAGLDKHVRRQTGCHSWNVQWLYVETMLCTVKRSMICGEKPNPLNAPPASPGVTSSEPQRAQRDGRAGRRSRGWRSTAQKATQPLLLTDSQHHCCAPPALLQKEIYFEKLAPFGWGDFKHNFACWVKWTLQWLKS